MIPVPEAGYSVEYVRAVVHSAKVFIRPIQKDLDLSCVKDVNLFNVTEIWKLHGSMQGAKLGLVPRLV